MLKITHRYGFFSCCSVILKKIREFNKIYKKLPDKIDSSEVFTLYKYNKKIDITYDFFEHYNNINININQLEYNDTNIDYDQFNNYKTLNYNIINPLIKKYFTPTQNIIDIKNELLKKYNIDTENCIGLYFRGTDKIIETIIDTFDSYYNKLNEIISLNNSIQIIIQTDSAQFLDYLKDKKINFICINENKTSYKKKGIHYENIQSQNYIDIKNLFATFLIISKCKYIICSSSNCSVWMMYYRGNGNNIYQNLNKQWL